MRSRVKTMNAAISNSFVGRDVRLLTIRIAQYDSSGRK
jgi:hypothetical protein